MYFACKMASASASDSDIDISSRGNTIYPGTESEFYIQHDQLPDINIIDVKMSFDTNYISVTGANALSYIYKRNAVSTEPGYYKLDWECQHQRLAKSVINFIGFGEHDMPHKYIICPVLNGMIYQYEILDDDTIIFKSALDISDCEYHCIHWLICTVHTLHRQHKKTHYLNIFTTGSHPIDNKIFSPMAEFYSSRKLYLKNYDKLFDNEHVQEIVIEYFNTPMMPTKNIFHANGSLYISTYKYETCKLIIYYIHTGTYTIARPICAMGLNLIYNEFVCVPCEYKDIYNINYDKNNLWKDIYGIRPFKNNFTISEVKSAHNNYIIQAFSDNSISLYKGDENFKFELIKSYENMSNIMLMNFITITNKHLNYIITHEKQKNDYTQRLGFILNIPSSNQCEIQEQRLTNLIQHLLSEATIPNTLTIPPELIQIIQSYL